MNRVVFTGVLALILAQGASRADDAATFKGNWKFTAVNAGGVPVPDEIVKSLELKLAKDELELSGTFLKETIKSKVTLDEKARTFDFEPTSGDYIDHYGGRHGPSMSATVALGPNDRAIPVGPQASSGGA